ncbi:MAG: hypothetical protein ACXAEB_05660 [Candidatus Thorarchaeota archaeon]
MSERLHELEKIFVEVSAGSENASRETRKRFWKLVLLRTLVAKQENDSGSLFVK